jgi:hypothetical protein
VRHYVFRNQIEGEQGPLVRIAFERGPTGARTHRSRTTPRSPPFE